MEDIGTEATEKALKFERQHDAAETFAMTLEDVDTAEYKLRYFMESTRTSDDDFWQEVIVAIAQIRG